VPSGSNSYEDSSGMYEPPRVSDGYFEVAVNTKQSSTSSILGDAEGANNGARGIAGGGFDRSRVMLRERCEYTELCRSRDFGGIGGAASEAGLVKLNAEDGLELVSEIGEEASERVGVVIGVGL